MDIPGGLLVQEEWDVVRRVQGGEVKEALVTWLLGMADWKTEATLTFESVAHPERAEKAVRRWLGQVAPRALAVVAYERQERGAVHCHVIMAQVLDCERAAAAWRGIGGFCRVGPVKSAGALVEYVVKHCVKGLDFEILGCVDRQPVFDI